MKWSLAGFIWRQRGHCSSFPLLPAVYTRFISPAEFYKPLQTAASVCEHSFMLQNAVNIVCFWQSAVHTPGSEQVHLQTPDAEQNLD